MRKTTFSMVALPVPGPDGRYVSRIPETYAGEIIGRFVNIADPRIRVRVEFRFYAPGDGIHCVDANRADAEWLISRAGWSWSYDMGLSDDDENPEIVAVVSPPAGVEFHRHGADIV